MKMDHDDSRQSSGHFRVLTAGHLRFSRRASITFSSSAVTLGTARALLALIN
jgi:hypothetical protein